MQPRNLASWVAALGASALTFTAASCAPVHHRTGWATYYVTVEDHVIDRFGVVQSALCGDYVTFVGEVDATCAERPMVWSYAQVVPLDCTYRDAQGRYQYYWDYFSFPDGYIAEADCDGMSRQVVTAVALRSEPAQPRDAAHNVVLGSTAMLTTPGPTITDLRSALDAHLDGPPVTRLASDAIGSARVGDTTLLPEN